MRQIGILLIFLVNGIPTFACNSCGSAGNTGTFGFGSQVDQHMISLRYESRSLTTTHPVNLLMPEVDHRSFEQIGRASLFGQYIIKNRVIAAVNIPYHMNNQESELDAYNQNLKGLGDISVYGGWSQPLYADSLMLRSVRFRGIFGIKLPTGPDKGPVFGEGLVAPIMQRGSGSTDLNFILSLSGQLNKWFFSSQYVLWHNGMNTEGYRYGKNQFAILELARNLEWKSLQIQPLATTRFIHSSPNQWQGSEVEYTGEYILDAAPGLRLIQNNWIAEAAYFIPCMQNQADRQVSGNNTWQISMSHVFN